MPDAPDIPPPPRRPRRWWIPAVYLILAAIGIPWYWPADDQRIWFGMPAWNAVALGASMCTSAFTAFVFAFFWSTGQEAD